MQDKTLDEQQDAELDEFEERRRRSYERGKRLIYLVVGVNMASDIIMYLMTHELQPVKLAVHIALCVALIYGVTWVRYLYAAAGILTVLLMIMALPELVSLMQFSSAAGGYLLLLALVAGYSLALVVIMLFNRNVKEYMYQKKSERQR